MHLCPNCVEPLRSRTMSNFTVDECPMCDGLWFDDQVPEKMVVTVDKPQFFFEPIAFEKKREVPEGQLQCPRCKVTMAVFAFVSVLLNYALIERGYQRIDALKAEKRNGVRVRMSAEEAREIVDYGTIPADVVNRIGYQLWGVK